MSTGTLLSEVVAYQAKPLDQQDPEELRELMKRARGAGAGAPAGAPIVPLIPSPGARAAASATIMGTLTAFMARKRAMDEQQVQAVLLAQARKMGEPDADVQAILDLEAERGRQFADAQDARLRAALPQILAMPEGAARADAMQALMAREERFERQRAQAMFGRAVNGLNRVVVKGQSPMGAFWKLSPYVKEHTAGCLVMGERFWPWEVLDKLHPPRHPGCPCHLESYGSAIGNGWMRPEDVRSVPDALAMAAGVTMEALEGPTFELERRLGPLRAALAAQGMVDVREFDRLAGVA